MLLLSVNNQLGDIGYTMTIEYIFYAFFALCLASMLIGIAHDALSVQGKCREVVALARGGQIFYVVSVVAVTHITGGATADDHGPPPAGGTGRRAWQPLSSDR